MDAADGKYVTNSIEQGIEYEHICGVKVKNTLVMDTNYIQYIVICLRPSINLLGVDASA